VFKDAAKVRLLTSAGLIDAKVVQTDAANDLALLKADGRFAPLPIAASRRVQLGSTVATVGFPDPGLQGFSPKVLAHGHHVSAALAMSGSLPENVNYAVKSSFLLSFLESVPDVVNKIKEPSTKDEKFEDVVKDAQNAAVLILVY
jgi:S1-C subfamily serine protease